MTKHKQLRPQHMVRRSPWKVSSVARPCSRSDMVMSHGSMPALYTAELISRSPLLPSSRMIATRTCNQDRTLLAPGKATELRLLDNTSTIYR